MHNQNYLEFISYQTDDILKIFNEGLGNLTDKISESFKNQFTEEIIKNVFNDTRRYELSLKEDSIIKAKKSDRGFSIDEGVAQ